jgi:hypothetical protein
MELRKNKGQFEEDLKIGQIYEKKVGEIYLKKGFEVEYNESGDYVQLCQHDLKLTKNEKSWTVEVKMDDRTQYTNRVAFDIATIFHSTANVWVFVLTKINNEDEDEYWMIHRNVICNEYNFWNENIRQNGTYNAKYKYVPYISNRNSEMLCIDYNYFTSIATRIITNNKKYE